MKDLLMEFTAVVYPDDYDKQDKLFEDMMTANHDPLPNVTIESFRNYYERYKQCPMIALEDMVRLVREFHQSGQMQTAPALTVQKVAAALGITPTTQQEIEKAKAISQFFEEHKDEIAKAMGEPIAQEQIDSAQELVKKHADS